MYESAFQMGSDGFVFAGTGGRDSAVCSAGGLCRCSAGRVDPLQRAAAALSVPVSRGIAPAHPMPGKRPAGPAVPFGGVGHRHPQTLCGTGALHRVPGWLCTSSQCGGAGSQDRSAHGGGSGCPAAGLYLFRAILCGADGRAELAGQCGAWCAAVCGTDHCKLSDCCPAEPVCRSAFGQTGICSASIPCTAAAG